VLHWAAAAAQPMGHAERVLQWVPPLPPKEPLRPGAMAAKSDLPPTRAQRPRQPVCSGRQMGPQSVLQQAAPPRGLPTGRSRVARRKALVWAQQRMLRRRCQMMTVLLLLLLLLLLMMMMTMVMVMVMLRRQSSSGVRLPAPHRRAVERPLRARRRPHMDAM